MGASSILAKNQEEQLKRVQGACDQATCVAQILMAVQGSCTELGGHTAMCKKGMFYTGSKMAQGSRLVSMLDFGGNFQLLDKGGKQLVVVVLMSWS